MVALKLSVLLSLLFLTGCMTFSVSMIHSEGMSKDSVSGEQVQDPSTTANPTVTIPAKL